LFPSQLISCSRRSLAVWGCEALLVALVSGRALAQEVADPAASARFRIGPLRFTPGISVTDLGLDTNVFNEVDNPKEDRTAALGPAVNFWLNLGRSRFSGKSNGQYLYFDKYANQRAWNTSNEAKWELPLARMTPFIGGAYQNTKNRSGFEIADGDWLYDAAVSGADPIEGREGFARLLDRIEGNGVTTVIVEDASRFAREVATYSADP